MASTITHACFILDVCDKIDSEARKLLINQSEMLKMSAQGMDPLFFYKIIHPKKGARVREFGNFFHRNCTNDFFVTMINYIKYNGYASNPEVMAFLYGLLSHMVLDSQIHPYIIYKTGIFDKDKKDTYRYNMLHEEVESYIDNYMISLKFNIKPHKFKCHDFCFNGKINNTLSEVIDFTFKEVFDINNMTKFYTQSIDDMHKFYRIFRYDPYGIKKKFYSIVDFFSPDYFRRKTPLSYKVSSMRNYLNFEHKLWYNPANRNLKYHTSVIDIYTLSVNYCANLIKNVNKYIYDDVGDISKIIPNVSYVTGLELESNDDNINFFEF